MSVKNATGAGNIKEFQPWFFIIGGIFSLGVIWGVLNSRIEKNEAFQDTQKHTNETGSIKEKVIELQEEALSR